MSAVVFDGRMEAAVVVPAGGWTVSATNGSGGPNTCTLAAGTYFLSDDATNGWTGLLTAFANALNASRPSGWTVTLSTGPGGDGRVSIFGTGTWGITFTSAELGTLLGYNSNSIIGPNAPGQGTLVADKQCAAVWMPDCPLALDSNPRSMPIVSDARSTVSPNFVVRTVIGNIGYRQKRPRYSMIPPGRMWEANAGLGNASWEKFAKNTQLGQGGFTSMSPGSAVQVYDHTGTLLGRVASVVGGPVNGWQFMPAISSVEPAMTQDQYTGLWKLELPDLVSSG